MSDQAHVWREAAIVRRIHGERLASLMFVMRLAWNWMNSRMKKKKKGDCHKDADEYVQMKRWDAKIFREVQGNKRQETWFFLWPNYQMAPRPWCNPHHALPKQSIPSKWELVWHSWCERETRTTTGTDSPDIICEMSIYIKGVRICFGMPRIFKKRMRLFVVAFLGTRC